MRTLAIIASLIFIGFHASGQKQGQALIDSLLTEVSKAPNDSIKVRIYKQIVEGYFFIDIEKALYYSRIGLVHAERVPWQRGISVHTMNIGRAYSDKGMIDSCLFYYNKALAIQKSAGDNRNIASTLLNMGTAEQNIRSDYTKATRYYFEALGYAEKEKSAYMISAVYDNLSVIYLAQNDNPKALSYAFKALRLCEKQDGSDPSFMNEWAISVFNVASAYNALHNAAKAKFYFEKAIAMYTRSESIEGLATSYFGLASLPGLDVKSRIEYGLKSKSLWDKLNPMSPNAVDNVGKLGIAYLDLVRGDSLKSLPATNKNTLLAQAEDYIQTAIRLNKQKGAVQGRSFYTGLLSELQALKGDYKNAYKNYRQFQEVQDSLFSQENKNKIAGLEGKREIELRDKEIQLTKLALETQEKQRIGFLIGLVLLTVIGGLLFWQSHTRKRTNATLIALNSELDAANKLKARFFAILSHDLRSPVANLINFLHLQKENPEMLTADMTERHQKRITESAEGLLENMESMLLWSKGQMQHFQPQKKPIPVEDLFSYIDKFFSGTANVVFEFNNPDLLTVFSDEDYLKTIMQNLTSNAVKSLKGQTAASIRWAAKKEAGRLTLSITDNGPGAAAEQLAALYSDQENIGSKSGLGLHLVRDLAKAISCSITAKSAPDQGASFQLVFTE